MSTNNPSLIKKTFLEMIPVILGILIALLINGWKENYDDQKFVRATLSNISEELKENKHFLEEGIPKHEVIIDTIYEHLEDEMTIGGILGAVQGIQIASIKNTAWKAFLNQNIKLIDYPIVSSLTDIEETKQAMNITINKFIDFVYQNANSSDPDQKQIFLMITEDFSIMEEDMLEYHVEALKAIENSTK